MNKENAKDYLRLVQALSEGRVIQINLGTDSIPAWRDTDIDLLFGAPASTYRIKPEPREIWVVHYPGGVYAYETEEKANRSRIEHGVTRRYREVME